MPVRHFWIYLSSATKQECEYEYSVTQNSRIIVVYCICGNKIRQQNSAMQTPVTPSILLQLYTTLIHDTTTLGRRRLGKHSQKSRISLDMKIKLFQLKRQSRLTSFQTFKVNRHFRTIWFSQENIIRLHRLKNSIDFHFGNPCCYLRDSLI